MNEYVRFALIICVLIGVILSIVFKILRNHKILPIIEFVTSCIFVGYTSDYAYLFGYLFDISFAQLSRLILFIVSIAVCIYKFISLIIKR